LPILTYDASSDFNLLITGSVDKDIKIWGLDFGNCVKSIFAHSEAVTIVKFVKDTHYFFSGSKDGHIKYWDGDKYQLILDF
jgi:U3 small nucleolar RNA-associated protein 12